MSSSSVTPKIVFSKELNEIFGYYIPIIVAVPRALNGQKSEGYYHGHPEDIKLTSPVYL